MWTVVLCSTERIYFEKSSSGVYKVMSDESGVLGRNGTIRGVGGWTNMEQAKSAGADALRTWHLSDLPDAVVKAEARGLKISAGIWLTHNKTRYETCHESDLEEDTYWQHELKTYLAAVRAAKNSSSILWWTVGNEMELEVNWAAGTECLWKRLEWVARAVKAEDPDHPIGTVFAGLHQEKVNNVLKLCPSIDFLGVNSYGDSSLRVGSDLASWNWPKPYTILEYGPTGHWEAPVTAWGAFIEETSSQKVARYLATCNSCQLDPSCIGGFAFVWGWKWEKTGTWYGMFNEWDDVTKGVTANCTSCSSEVVAAVESCWKAEVPSTAPPTIHSVSLNGAVLAGMRFSVDLQTSTIEVNATQKQGHPLTAVWAVTEDVVSDAIGGAFEATNPLISGLFGTSKSSGLGLSTQLNTSKLTPSTNYRLYVFVREDPSFCGSTCPRHEAVANMPFHICHDAAVGDECYEQVAFAMRFGIHSTPGRYPGVSAASSFSEFQMSLAQTGLGNCQMPCGIQDWCHTTKPGDECYSHVNYTLQHGLNQSGSLYTGLSSKSTIEAVQEFLHDHFHGVCPRPCKGKSLPCEPFCIAEEEDLATKEQYLSGAPTSCSSLAAAITLLMTGLISTC
jgi:hypothetical protein